MKILKNKSLNKDNGITLIALVITIIVLLILAGVSIAMLTGENGLLTKATDAELRTNIEDEKEIIKLEILGNLDNQGKVDLNKLKECLEEDTENIEILSKTDNLLKVKFKKTGSVYEIDDGSNVEESTEKTLITFSILGGNYSGTYEAEEGMTWYEWGISPYNTTNLSPTSPTGSICYDDAYVSNVRCTEVIEAGGRYYMEYMDFF